MPLFVHSTFNVLGLFSSFCRFKCFVVNIFVYVFSYMCLKDVLNSCILRMEFLCRIYMMVNINIMLSSFPKWLYQCILILIVYKSSYQFYLDIIRVLNFCHQIGPILLWSYKWLYCSKVKNFLAFFCVIISHPA